MHLNLQFKGYGYIVEADIKGFFNNMDHQWLMQMLALRIDDKALLNLINQWLKARIKTPDGKFEKPISGTPQGGVISPVLANIYLHYALDLWFEERVKPRLKGRAMLIRYADDFVVAFQYRTEAQAFYRELPEGFRNYFGLLDNSRSLSHIYDFVLHTLYKWLNRRSQWHSFNWQGFKDMLRYYQIQPLRVSKRYIVVDWY
ncbi:MAG: RNA-directed DNA polymerase (Reverse transcriptase) [Osedax symbiont Rs1]|nr:MAG: RNA-directed DNA polymerase (Reverse transcriptase) [Osedax symbiont Rs1]